MKKRDQELKRRKRCRVEEKEKKTSEKWAPRNGLMGSGVNLWSRDGLRDVSEEHPLNVIVLDCDLLERSGTSGKPSQHVHA